MSQGDSERLGRREALVGMAATLGAATLGVGGAASRAVALDTGTLETGALETGALNTAPDASEAADETRPVGPHGLRTPDAGVEALFGDLTGRVIEGHWRIEAVHAVRAGAIPVVFSIRTGQRFAAEVFRWDPTDPAPLGRAGELAIYLANGGDGATATHEMGGLGARALGRALQARLASGAPVPEGLTSLGVRSRLHPRGAFDIPC